MSEKRRDHKGRILRTGESQRKDLLYQYRYTDIHGKRKTVYSPKLSDLREKEKEIQKQLNDGIDYAAGEITVLELVERYIRTKRGVRRTTRNGYRTAYNHIKEDDFGCRKIRDIKVSEAQEWFAKLSESGMGYATISNIKSVVKPAFQSAYEDDVIVKNPFNFKLTDIVPKDTKSRVALTEEQQKIWMSFIRNDNICSKHYDEFVVLLGTGMRVSEFCGLTISDLDFENRRIRVDHQLLQDSNGRYYVERTKSKSGVRFIPMTDDVCRSLTNILANRPDVKTELIVDGRSEFILINKLNQPKVNRTIEYEIRYAQNKFARLYPDQPLPNITPHVLRHTFCTNMANAGMDIKNLQYLMGHSNAGITMDVYTHASYDLACEQMRKIIPFSKSVEENGVENLEKSSRMV